VAVVRTNVSQAFISFIRVERINLLQLLVTANVVHSSLIISNLMMEKICLSPKRRFLQGPHDVTSGKAAFVMAIAVKT
jgi:hypothetical protein